jgi:hypothetical protein
VALTYFYERMPTPPWGSHLHKVLTWYVQIREMRKAEAASLLIAALAPKQVKLAEVQKAMYEAFGVRDRGKEQEHRAAVSDALRQWMGHGPVRVQKLATHEQQRDAMLRKIRDRRANARALQLQQQHDYIGLKVRKKTGRGK